MRLIKTISLLIVLTIVVGCSNETEPKESEDKKETLEGYVLEVEGKRFLMINDEDKTVYDELKDLTMEEMLKLDPETPVIYVNYPSTEKLKKGDHIKVEYDGVITFSIPGQISSSKVTKVE